MRCATSDGPVEVHREPVDLGQGAVGQAAKFGRTVAETPGRDAPDGAQSQTARRYARPLSFCMFDVDHFKRYNDAHGHRSGDAILEEVARLDDTMQTTHELIEAADRALYQAKRAGRDRVVAEPLPPV